MSLGQRVALISDVHGEHRMLRKVLNRCHADGVETLVLLGDLFDRLDQAEACARYLSEWTVAGVTGNHEREALESLSEVDQIAIRQTMELLAGLHDRLVIDDVMFVHDDFGWKPNGQHDPAINGRKAWITFAGHTHYRSARDDNGPLDLSMGRIQLRQERRYLINPGAVVEGQFAIWDREQAQVIFQRV